MCYWILVIVTAHCIVLFEPAKGLNYYPHVTDGENCGSELMACPRPLNEDRGEIGAREVLIGRWPLHWTPQYVDCTKLGS